MQSLRLKASFHIEQIKRLQASHPLVAEYAYHLDQVSRIQKEIANAAHLQPLAEPTNPALPSGDPAVPVPANPGEQ